jgi:hypothetical protein
MVASLAGPAAGTPRALRRPCQGRPGPGDPASLDPHDLRGAARARRVLRNRGLTVVAAPADTDYTIRQAAAWSVAALITLAAAISVLLSKTVAGPPLPLCRRARRRSPRSTTQVRNRGALAPGLMRIG